MDIKVQDLERGRPWGRMSHHTEGTRSEGHLQRDKGFLQGEEATLFPEVNDRGWHWRAAAFLGRDTSYTHPVERHPEVRGPHERASPSCRIKEELSPCGYAWFLLASSGRSLPQKTPFSLQGIAFGPS